jgi:hypothetical protein
VEISTERDEKVQGRNKKRRTRDYVQGDCIEQKQKITDIVVDCGEEVQIKRNFRKRMCSLTLNSQNRMIGGQSNKKRTPSIHAELTCEKEEGSGQSGVQQKNGFTANHPASERRRVRIRGCRGCRVPGDFWLFRTRVGHTTSAKKRRRRRG